MVNKIDLLNGTVAGQIAQKLDAKDGSKDNKISASVWNDFVKDKGGKTVTDFISVNDAIKSITRYCVKVGGSEKKTAEDIGARWLAAEGGPVKAAPKSNSKSAAASPTPKDSVNQLVDTADDVQAVSVSVPKKTVKAPEKTEVDKITKNQKEGKAIAKSINDAKAQPNNDVLNQVLDKINEGNAAYVVNNFLNVVKVLDALGIDKNAIVEKLLMPLAKKCDELGIKWKNGKSAVEIASSLPDTENIYVQASNFSKAIIEQENKVVKKYNKDFEDYKTKKAEADKYNQALPQTQKMYNKANSLLAAVANLDKSSYTITESDDEKIATLSDGRYIKVRYSDGEIASISISYDTTKNADGDDTPEVFYVEGSAETISTSEDLTGNYGFDKLKALATKIFG